MESHWASVDLQPYLDAAPLAWTVALLGMLIVGVLLWLAGGKLAKAGVVMAGFVIGGLGMMAAAVAWTEGGPFLIGLGVGGALAGALLAALLFRLWIALTAAVLLSAVVPAAVLVWTGQTPPTEPMAGAAALAQDTSAALLEESTVAGEVAAGAGAEMQTFLQTLRDAWAAQLDAVKAWWSELPATQKSVVYGGGLGGSVVGLLLGLIVPKAAAALQTALAGAMLIFASARLLIERYLGGSDVLPGTPRSILLTLGLITLLGLLIQWAMLRRRTDK